MFPDLGRERDDLFPGCRALRIESHVVYYRVTTTEIVVSRVLQVRQDATATVTQ